MHFSISVDGLDNLGKMLRIFKDLILNIQYWKSKSHISNDVQTVARFSWEINFVAENQIKFG